MAWGDGCQGLRFYQERCYKLHRVQGLIGLGRDSQRPLTGFDKPHGYQTACRGEGE